MSEPVSDQTAGTARYADPDHAGSGPADSGSNDSGSTDSGSTDSGYADLVGRHGRELAAAVAVIADADGPLLVHGPADLHPTALVLALALLAAGVPHDDALAAALPAESDPAALRHALATVSGHGGTEAYLLRHGLTVSHFHLLRERFAGDEAGLAAGDVS
jgi:hypothetical protein